MRPEHVERYRLYDPANGNRLIATGQAALDRWRVGLTVRWIVPDDVPVRRISAAARYRGRRRRLRKRLEQRAPLLAQQLEEAALAARPEYYGIGGTIMKRPASSPGPPRAADRDPMR